MKKYSSIVIQLLLIAVLVAGVVSAVNWEIVSTSGTGKKCPAQMKAVSFAKGSGYFVEDYATILLADDSMAQVGLCSYGGSGEAIIQTEPFVYDSSVPIKMKMHIPVVSGFQVYIGVDGKFWKQMNSPTWWKGISDTECYKDMKVKGSSIDPYSSEPIYSSYSFSSAQWSDKEPHSLSLRVVKGDDADCFNVMHIKDVEVSSSKGSGTSMINPVKSDDDDSSDGGVDETDVIPPEPKSILQILLEKMRDKKNESNPDSFRDDDGCIKHQHYDTQKKECVYDNDYGADWNQLKQEIGSNTGANNIEFNEFLLYLKKIEKANPDKNWKQIVAKLHYITYEDDVDNGLPMPFNLDEFDLFKIRLFQHGKETEGFEGVDPLTRCVTIKTGDQVCVKPPKTVVGSNGKTIDVMHTLAAIRSDLNRWPTPHRWIMRNCNTNWGDYWQVAGDTGVKNSLKGEYDGSRAPRTQIRGNEAGMILAEFYRDSDNKDVPLSEAFEMFFSSDEALEEPSWGASWLWITNPTGNR